MAEINENAAISPTTNGPSVPPVVAAAPHLDASASTPAPKAPQPKAKASARNAPQGPGRGPQVLPPPPPPPPDTRTPEEHEALARAFLANGEETPAAAATTTESQNAEPTEVEEQPLVPEESSPEAALNETGPDWLVSALQAVPEGALPDWLPDRLLKLAKSASKAKEQLAQVQAQLDEAKATLPVKAEPTPEEPLAHITTEAELNQALTQAKAVVENAEAWIEWCADNREGGETVPGDEGSWIDADQVKAKLAEARAYKRWAQNQINAGPTRAEWVKKSAQTRAVVLKERPELLDRTSEEHQEMVSLLSKPLAAREDAYQIYADYLAGKEARQARERGVQTVQLGQKPVARPKVAGAPTRAATPPVRAAGAPVDLTALRERARNGDENAANQMAQLFLGAST